MSERQEQYAELAGKLLYHIETEMHDHATTELLAEADKAIVALAREIDEQSHLEATILELTREKAELEAEVQRLRDSQSGDGPRHGWVDLGNHSALWSEGLFLGYFGPDGCLTAADGRDAPMRKCGPGSTRASRDEAEAWLREQWAARQAEEVDGE